MSNKLKNTLLSLLLLLVFHQGNAQRIDTIINKPAYHSYFSFAVKSPLYVVYYLYKGGGDCSRKDSTGDHGKAGSRPSEKRANATG